MQPCIWASEEYFPGGPMAAFSMGEPKVLKFHFIHSKTKRETFFSKKAKYKISTFPLPSP